MLDPGGFPMTRSLLYAVLFLGAALPAGAQGAPAAAPGNPGQDTSAERAVRQAERDRRDAMLRGDAQALGGLLAADYVGTGARGRVRTKGEVVAQYRAGAVKYESLTEDDVQIRIHGSAAVVTGRTRSKGKEEGKSFGGEHRFTRVWVERQGRWQLVAWHSSRVG
jgi:ketosteroid isomerase-like protein